LRKKNEKLRTICAKNCTANQQKIVLQISKICAKFVLILMC